jgi:hypothetical protein
MIRAAERGVDLKFDSEEEFFTIKKHPTRRPLADSLYDKFCPLAAHQTSPVPQIWAAVYLYTSTRNNYVWRLTDGSRMISGGYQEI